MLQGPKLTAVTDHITGARLTPYLLVTGSDLSAALRLYRWNIELAGAMYEALGIAEIFLRNAIDTQLRSWNAAQPTHPTRGITYNHEWVKTPATPRDFPGVGPRLSQLRRDAIHHRAVRHLSVFPGHGLGGASITSTEERSAVHPAMSSWWALDSR